MFKTFSAIRLTLAAACIAVPVVAWAQGNYTPPPDPVPVAASGAAPANQQAVPYPGTMQPATAPVYQGPPAPSGAPYQPVPSYQPQPAYPPPQMYAQPAQYGQPVYAQPEYVQPPQYAQPTYVQPPVYVQPPGYVQQPAYIQPQNPTVDANICLPADAPRWLFSAEALWLERTDDRDELLGETVTNNGGPSFVVDQLTSGDQSFPLAAGVKFQFGYRMNDRDAIELSYFGLQNWSVGRSIHGDPIGDSVLAFSPWTQTDSLVGGFDNQLGYTYSSRVNNLEVNERFAGTGGITWSVAGLWGIRYVQVADKFNLNGSDTATDSFENIDIKATNNLLGPQVGIQIIRDWNRFQLNSEFKAGLFANFIDASYSNLNSSGAINGQPAGFVPINQTQNTTAVAGVFEFSLVGRYRVNDHFWIRGGWTDYFLAGLALGPRQLGNWNHSGSIGLDGPSLGLEAAW